MPTNISSPHPLAPLNQPTIVEDISIELELDTLLKRYKTPRRRKKMLPIYTRALEKGMSLTASTALYGHAPDEVLPALQEWVPAHTAGMVFGLVTLGQSFDDHMAHLGTDEDIVAASVIHEIGLALIVRLANYVHHAVRDAAPAIGLKAGPPYRPGVGRWPMESQGIVFPHIPADMIGVRISPQLVMYPTYSTTLAIPLLDKEKGTS